jgi:hypothetical protein
MIIIKRNVLEIYDLSSIQMSFRRNVTPLGCDKKILSCAKTFLDHAFQSWSVPKVDKLATSYLGNFHHTILSLDVVNLSSDPCKTPTLFSRMTFLNFVLMLTVRWLCLCLSSDLLSSPFWLMDIKTRWSFWKSYHCLKYTLIEHTVVSLFHTKAGHNKCIKGGWGN